MTIKTEIINLPSKSENIRWRTEFIGCSFWQRIKRYLGRRRSLPRVYGTINVDIPPGSFVCKFLSDTVFVEHRTIRLIQYFDINRRDMQHSMFIFCANKEGEFFIYDLGNTHQSGWVCWGPFSTHPTDLRELWSSWCNQPFNGDLSGILSDQDLIREEGKKWKLDRVITDTYLLDSSQHKEYVEREMTQHELGRSLRNDRISFDRKTLHKAGVCDALLISGKSNVLKAAGAKKENVLVAQAWGDDDGSLLCKPIGIGHNFTYNIKTKRAKKFVAKKAEK